jgi:hypothetical protein
VNRSRTRWNARQLPVDLDACHCDLSLRQGRTLVHARGGSKIESKQRAEPDARLRSRSSTIGIDSS